MREAAIHVGHRRFFVYSFPDVADSNGNFELTLLTDSDYCVTSVSSKAGNTFFLYNVSVEKQTTPTLLPQQKPILSGNGGTPYFFPVPWALKAGTLLRLVPINVTAQVSLGGYRTQGHST